MLLETVTLMGRREKHTRCWEDGVYTGRSGEGQSTNRKGARLLVLCIIAIHLSNRVCSSAFRPNVIEMFSPVSCILLTVQLQNGK